MPITSPLEFKRAPPLLPGLIAASVWMTVLVASSTLISLFNALTCPTVTLWPSPSALPMAITPCPIFKESESPSVAALILPFVSAEILSSGTAITARSASESVPLMAASAVLSSANVTVSPSESLTTWLFVTIRSSESFCPTMMPEPLLGTS